MTADLLIAARTGVVATLGASDLLDLLMHFAMLSMLSIGGAITMAPDMHRYLVDDKNWMADAQFADSITMAQAAPGPNVLFVTLMGWQAAGPAGALATTLGMMVPSSALALFIGRRLRAREESRIARAIRTGLAPIAIGLTLSTGWLLARAADLNWKLTTITVVTVLLMLRTRLNPLWLIAAAGMLGAAGLTSA